MSISFRPRLAVRIAFSTGVAGGLAVFISGEGAVAEPWMLALVTLVLVLGSTWAWTAVIRLDGLSISKTVLGMRRRIVLTDIEEVSIDVETGLRTIAMWTIRLRGRSGSRIVVRTGWWARGRVLCDEVRARTAC